MQTAFISYALCCVHLTDPSLVPAGEVSHLKKEHEENLHSLRVQHEEELFDSKQENNILSAKVCQPCTWCDVFGDKKRFGYFVLIGMCLSLFFRWKNLRNS